VRLPDGAGQVQTVSAQEDFYAQLLASTRQDVQQAPGPLYLSDLVRHLPIVRTFLYPLAPYGAAVYPLVYHPAPLRTLLCSYPTGLLYGCVPLCTALGCSGALCAVLYLLGLGTPQSCDLAPLLRCMSAALPAACRSVWAM
jgi:hypothetical protein